jgi:hypothetical protein
MRWLLKLYPPAWRRRYEAEVAALLEESRGGTRSVVDVLRGAADAWVIGPRGPLGGLGVWVAVIVYLSATIGVAIARRNVGNLAEPFETLYEILYWILFIFFVTWLADQPAARCNWPTLGRRR